MSRRSVSGWVRGGTPYCGVGAALRLILVPSPIALLVDPVRRYRLNGLLPATPAKRIDDVVTAQDMQTIGFLSIALCLVVFATGVAYIRIEPDQPNPYGWQRRTRRQTGESSIGMGVVGLPIAYGVLIAGLAGEGAWLRLGVALGTAVVLLVGGLAYIVNTGIVAPQIAKRHAERRMLKRIRRRQAGPTRVFRAP